MNWHKSFYWRIAVGFVAFLAAMLVVQAMGFTWMMSVSGRTMPGQSPAQFARTIAIDLAGALERDPELDVTHYVHDQFNTVTHPFFVLLTDGRIVTNSSEPPSEAMLRIGRARLRRLTERPDAERGRGTRSDAERPDAEQTGFRQMRPEPVMVNGQVFGVVMVPTRASFGFLLGHYAPMLSLVATGVMIVGTVIASAVIFGPARRRLHALETAARQFGAGDLAARAPDRGGDEIASVARAFNSMADALASSDRTRRQLLADVSHELTTPITAMRGYLETLSMPEIPIDEATRARYLTIVGDEAGRLERIIGDLLDLARLEGGGGTLVSEPVAVSHVFERVVARHERACAAAGITMSSTIEPGAEMVWGDRDRLEQAVQNLAANAIRHSPEGSTVRLSAGPRPDGIALAVADQGSGIAPEHLPHIFDRFYKADSSRGKTSAGSGLGLSIVKAIVERHGGRISIDSRPTGTVFEAVLPSAPAA